MIYIISYHLISYHIISYHSISYHNTYTIYYILYINHLYCVLRCCPWSVASTHSKQTARNKKSLQQDLLIKNLDGSCALWFFLLCLKAKLSVGFAASHPTCVGWCALNLQNFLDITQNILAILHGQVGCLVEIVIFQGIGRVDSSVSAQIRHGRNCFGQKALDFNSCHSMLQVRQPMPHSTGIQIFQVSKS